MRSTRQQEQAVGAHAQLDSPVMQSASEPLPMRLLHLEDDPLDAQSLHETLAIAGLQSLIRHVCDRDEFEAALDEGPYHLILCDFNHPNYDGASALTIARARQPDVPVIVIASAQGEEQAVKCLHLGATDYLLKQRLERLPNAVWRAIDRAKEQRKLREAEAELRASEERFRLLAQHSQDVFWFVGLNPERLLYVSPAFEEIWGAPATGFYEDPTLWTSMIDPEDRARVHAAWTACATGEASHLNIEYRVIRADGSTRVVCSTGSVFVDDARGGAHISGMTRDHTERTRLEHELRQSHKMEVIGQLAGGIAHDFNNLLTVIQGNSELVLDELEPGSAIYCDIREIKRASMSAAALTRQLLAFSRQQVLAPRPIELRTVALKVEQMLGRLLGDNIELVLELDENSGRVLADEGQVEQVIVNLSLNARDAMPRGGRITIGTGSVERHASGDLASSTVPYETLTVTDTGTGMDRATRERIFEPFFTTKQMGLGTGLGLSTVHGIVKQSHGDLEVTSTPGVGSTFTVFFPRSALEVVAKSPAPLPGIARGSETVLVVEDQPSLRDLVRRILEQRGYSVLIASDGDHALRVASAAPSPIHLVISDVVMPGISARVMAEQLRSARPELRVLFMSGHHNDNELLRTLENSRVDFLQKPFLPRDLAEKVREILERA